METERLVGRKLSRSNRMLVKEAYSRGVTFEVLSNKRFKMTFKEKSFIVNRGRITHSYNSRLATRTMNLKEVTSRLLRSGCFPAPENVVFSKGESERAWNWARFVLPVVLKPYNGTMGKLVFVNINNQEEFIECFEKVTEKHNSILVEQFIKGKEYRFTYVKNEVIAVAHRISANIIGDGSATVKELVNMKNRERKVRKNPIHKNVPLDRESNRVLLKQGISSGYIPKLNERIYLRENSNVSTGGDAIDVTELIDDEIKEKVRKAMMSIPGLRVCGVDVLINGDANIHILEVNPHPMLSIHHYPWVGNERNVIGKVIDGMFPHTKYQV